MNEKIGTTQTIMLIVNTILPTATVVLPVIIGTYAEQDSPLAVLLATVIGILVALIVGTIIRASQGAPFLDWVGRKTSPVVAFILGLLMLQYYVDVTATILREFVNFIKDNVLFNTPVMLIAVLILLITIYMVRSGIEPIARVNSIVIMLYVIYLPIYMFGLNHEMNVHRLLPMFDHSAASITLASITPGTWMSEVAILLFLAPYLKKPQLARYLGLMGIACVAFLLLFSMVSALLVFGPQYIKISAYPGFATVGVVQIGKFIENLDMFFISFWVLSLYMKFAIFLFATTECFKQTFKVKTSRPFIGALGLLIMLEGLYTWESSAKLNVYNAEGRFLVFFLFNLLVPLGAMALTRVRGKSKGKGWGT